MDQTKINFDNITECFERIVCEHPYETAITDEKRSYTFKQLSEAADRAAEGLICSGVAAGSMIAIELKKSAEYIIAQLAILRVGCVYVPLNAKLPSERIEYMFEVSGVSYVVCERNAREYTEVKNIPIDELLRYKPIDKADYRFSDHAYVLFTSGSTGRPKGILIKQSSVHNLVSSMKKRIRIFSEKKAGINICQTAEFIFDVSVGQTFLSLLTGNHLILMPDEIKSNISQLSGFIKSSKIDVIDFTPTFFFMYASYAEHSDTPCELPIHIVSCGEPLIKRLVDKIYANENWQNTVLYNFYGPTETCVYSTEYTIDRESFRKDERILIGTPLENTGIFILDESMKQCECGEVGEIYISGVGLAEEYIGQSELTAGAFLTQYPQYAQRLYKTGDLGRIDADGNVECIGRNDSQIKLRGYRIELKEIEEAIDRISAIGCSKVIAYPKDDSYVITAYFTKETEISLSEILAELGKWLPEYMIPHYFVPVEGFSLNLNGKLDKSKLPDYLSFALTLENSVNDTEDSVYSMMVGNIIKRSISNMHLSPNDNLKNCGCDSLTFFMIMIDLSREFSVDLSVSEIMQANTINKIAKLIESSKSANDTLQCVNLGNECTSFQNFMLSLERRERDISHSTLKFNMDYLIECSEKLDAEKLERSIKEVIDHNPVLRSSFEEHGGKYRMKTSDSIHFSVEQIKCSNLSDINVREYADEFCVEETPLFQVLILCDNDSQKILMNFHHAIFDYYSVQLFIFDVFSVYQGDPIISSPNGFGRYSARLSEKIPKQTQDFWNRYYKGRQRNINLKGDLKKIYRIYPGDEFEDIDFTLSETSLRQMRAKLKSIGVSEYIFFICAWARLLESYTGQNDIVIGTYVPGRTYDSESFWNAMGCFMNIIGYRVKLCNKENTVGFLQRQSEEYSETEEYQILSYYEAKRYMDDDDLVKGNLINTVFNYVFFDEIVRKDITMTIREIGLEPEFHPLAIKAYSAKDSVRFAMKYDTSVYSHVFAEEIANKYHEIIISMIKECEN